MLNNAPNNPKKKDGTSKYHQGLFIPTNKDKVYKLNSKGGIYYRSSWEQKMCHYLDRNPDIVIWGCECIGIPYKKTDVKKDSAGDMNHKTTEHTYYPDFWYKRKKEDGTIEEVLMEVKPYKETMRPKAPPFNATRKQLENFEYAMKLWNANMHKWKYTIEYCETQGIKFTIMTEQYLSRLKN